MTFVYFLQRWV